MNYIDGFVLPVPHDQIETYKDIVEEVAKIWMEHGALEYSEFVLDDSTLQGTLSFNDAVNNKQDEVVVFGWVVFESRQARDVANMRVSTDPRMADLINPLTQTSRPIFDAERMVYGGFRSLVHSSRENIE